MESMITFVCIFGLCVFMYAYIKMYQINKDYPTACKVLYIPEHDNPRGNRLPHTEVLDHEKHDTKFRIFQVAPQGVSEIESLIPTLNRRKDSVNIVEIDR